MNVHDLLQLPPGVAILFALMIWPAVWAAALLGVALAGDLFQQRFTARSHA
jgi:hypothetical protein